MLRCNRQDVSVQPNVSACTRTNARIRAAAIEENASRDTLFQHRQITRNCESTMQCWIYKGNKRPDTYLYLSERDAFHQAPAELIAIMGPLEFVMELDLAPTRKLAGASVGEVMKALTEQGYYLQMPPREAPDGLQ